MASQPHPHKYGAYQNEIYARGIFHNILPTVTTDPNALEAQARAAMSAKAFGYAAGGAGEHATKQANRLAFRQWKLIPRMLRDTTTRDMSVTLFGVAQPSPLLVAPVGVQRIFHEDCEIGVAGMARELGLPFVMSTASSCSVEEVAEASGAGERWFQLYWPHGEDVTVSLLKRAKSAGFRVLVVTLDNWVMAWRPQDLDHAYLPVIKGEGMQVGFSDPVFRSKFRAKSGREIEEDVMEASLAWSQEPFSGIAHTWDQIGKLKANWDGPIVLKGIQCVEDAELAVESGVQGIVVSNHGGRQLDGAVGSLDQLAEIAEAVGDRLTVLFDSGIRTGVDVIKALSLGAKAVLVGRPWIYGMGIAGAAGAKEVLRGILADIDQSMGLAGIANIKECTRERLKRVNYGGDIASSS